MQGAERIFKKHNCYPYRNKKKEQEAMKKKHSDNSKDFLKYKKCDSRN